MINSTEGSGNPQNSQDSESIQIPSSFFHGKLVPYFILILKESLPLPVFKNQIKGVFLQRLIAFKRNKIPILDLIIYLILSVTIKIEDYVNW